MCRAARAAVLLLLVCAAVGAAATPLQGPARATIEQFLLSQLAGVGGQPTVRIEAPAGSPLEACATLQPFLPQGVLPWGRFSVGVRCAGERPWTRYLPAQVTVQGRYLAAARPIRAGEVLGTGDAVERSGDLTRLPRTVVTDPSKLTGMVAVNAIAPGAPLRTDGLRGSIVIRQGQAVRLQAEGAGFVASVEGQAMTDASAGARLQVKTAQGRLVTGVARDDGTVVLRR